MAAARNRQAQAERQDDHIDCRSAQATQGRGNVELQLRVGERGLTLLPTGCVGANADRRRSIARSGDGDLDTEWPVTRLYAGNAEHAVPWTRMAW
jgi:hypothetical protein